MQTGRIQISRRNPNYDVTVCWIRSSWFGNMGVAERQETMPSSRSTCGAESRLKELSQTTINDYIYKRHGFLDFFVPKSAALCVSLRVTIKKPRQTKTLGGFKL